MLFPLKSLSFKRERNANRDGPEIEKIRASIKEMKKISLYEAVLTPKVVSYETLNSLSWSPEMTIFTIPPSPSLSYIIAYTFLLAVSLSKRINGSHFLGDALSNIKLFWETDFIDIFQKVKSSG